MNERARGDEQEIRRSGGNKGSQLLAASSR
jgi:hypothetical protein